MELLNTLRRLCNTHGPSGFESPVAGLVCELALPYVDEVSIDTLGSAIAIKRAKLPNPNQHKLLLDAHIDEIGLIITSHEQAYLRFSTLGRMDSRLLPGQQVTVLTDPPIPGFVAVMPPHVVSAEERRQAIPLDKLLIDVGLSGEALKTAVPVGTPVVIDTKLAEFGNGMVTAKALDNRAGIMAVLYALSLLKDVALPFDIIAVGSVLEESNAGGAKTAAFTHDPTWAVTVDVTYGSQPGASPHKTFSLGSGVAVGVGPNMHRELTEAILTIATQEGIPTTREVMTGHTHTNGWPIQVSRGGVPTAVLSIPLQSMHSPVEVARLSDIVLTSRLLAALAVELGKEDAVC